jgi:hypothetical protein
VLVCFGGASLCLSSTTGPERGRKKNPFHTPMPYPKTLADLLVAERMRAEQIAVRASEEAEVSVEDFRKFNLIFLKFLSISLKTRSEGKEGEGGEKEGRGGGERRRREETTKICYYDLEIYCIRETRVIMVPICKSGPCHTVLLLSLFLSPSLSLSLPLSVSRSFTRSLLPSLSNPLSLSLPCPFPYPCSSLVPVSSLSLCYLSCLLSCIYVCFGVEWAVAM